MTDSEWASKFWRVLTQAAKNNQLLLTYEEVSDKTGCDIRIVGRVLGCISKYCKKQKYPQLNSMVVRKKTGEIGEGAPDFVDPATRREISISPARARMLIKRDREKWLQRHRPKPRDFEELDDD